MIRSPFDPLAEAPRSLRDRIARKLGRTVEPMAIRLLSWCRSLDHRVESIEGRLEAGEVQLRSVAQAMRAVNGVGSRIEAIEAIAPQVEAIVSKIGAISAGLAALEPIPEKIRLLEVRADQAFWGREALAERMNQDDAREQALVERVAGLAAGVSALADRAEQLYWGREALVERMNLDDATVESIDRRLVALQEKVEEQIPSPQAFSLDYIALGRRLASLEDQVELLLGRLAGTQEGQAATLVAFPGPEKAAG
jgi:hypothetical protein